MTHIYFSQKEFKISNEEISYRVSNRQYTAKHQMTEEKILISTMKHGPEDDIIHLAPRKWVPRGKTKSENFDKC